MPKFNDIPYEKPVGADCAGSGSADLTWLAVHGKVEPYRELHGNPVKVFFLKVIRKMVKFYIEPTVAEQNEINARTTAVLNSLSARITKLEAENKALREQLRGGERK